jgi:teichuronic acid biosynthesis glycosyltransferase TuaC
VKVLVVAEYYPRAADPVLGIWAHRQALAARDAGAEVCVLVLHRPLPSLAALRAGDAGALREAVRQPGRARLDGIEVGYVRYLSPPRPWSYGTWGAWAAPPLALALARLRRRFPFELVHAHYAVPAGDAVRRAAPGVPLIVSVHGGDVYAASQRRSMAHSVRATLAHARLVLANSAGTAQRCARHGARATRVVHLGTDLPDLSRPSPRPAGSPPTLVTVGNLIERKRHRDVIAALPELLGRHPDLRYVVVGDGPERGALAEQARRLGVERHVEWRGRLPHTQALAAARAADLFVLPSVDEAFGVAYVEAMAGGVPAIGCRGVDGPQEIAAAGGGIVLVEAGDVAALSARIDALLAAPAELAELGRRARTTVERAFTWERCGRETMSAYGHGLRADLESDV